MKLTTAFACLGLLYLSQSIEAATEGPEEPGRHLFILSGQSNMRQPLPESFRRSVEKVFGKDRVMVSQLGRPSQPIKGWYKKWKSPEEPAGETPGNDKKAKTPAPNGHLYDALMKQVEREVGGKEIATVTFIWMQGEADAGKGWGEVYEEAFYGILDQIKTDLEVEQVNYVLGRINDYWTTDRGFVHGDMIRKIQEKIGDEHDYGDWVDTDDLNTGVNPWGIYMFCDGHFPPAAYAVMGERFAKKACLLIDPDLEFGNGVFTAAHIDSPEDIAGHAAIGLEVSGSKPEEGVLATLTDGAFGAPDVKDRSWVCFAAAEGESTELVIDLGENRVVDEVGLSLLHAPKTGAPFPRKMTMETSVDGENWQSLNRRNFTFKYGGQADPNSPENTRPRTLIALVPGPSLKRQATESRFLRIRIEAPQVFIDEIIVNPVSEG